MLNCFFILGHLARPSGWRPKKPPRPLNQGGGREAALLELWASIRDRETRNLFVPQVHQTIKVCLGNPIKVQSPKDQGVDERG